MVLHGIPMFQVEVAELDPVVIEAAHQAMGFRAHRQGPLPYFVRWSNVVTLTNSARAFPLRNSDAKVGSCIQAQHQREHR